MLFGIPAEEQEAVRDEADAHVQTVPGEPREFVDGNLANGEIFAQYVDWRAEHPSDDLMSELIESEFEDERGTVRR